MDVKYYTSLHNPDCYFVAVNDFIVAQWIVGRWRDNGLYRSISNCYKQVEWDGEPFNIALILRPIRAE